MGKRVVHSFSGKHLFSFIYIFIVSLLDEFSPCSVSRPCKDLTCKQDWPKDTISKWLIMQTPAALEILGLALAWCLLDPPACICEVLALLGATELEMPQEWLLLVSGKSDKPLGGVARDCGGGRHLGLVPSS